jgi:hypothetical protein
LVSEARGFLREAGVRTGLNPFNPDPRATIREGQQTSSEMMNAFFYYVRDREKLGLTVDGTTGRLKGK